jgi:mRNA-processing protein COX24
MPPSGIIRGRTPRPVDETRKNALGVGLGSVIKKRRKKMRKHKHKKMLKKTRWARRAHA